MAKVKTAPAVNEDDDAIAAIFSGQQPLQPQSPIVDTGNTPGSPVAPEASDDEAIAAIFSGQTPEAAQPEAPPETMTGKLLKGGVEAFQKYNPLGLAGAVKMGQEMVGNVVGGVNEFGANVTQDPAAVASTMAGGALQGAADLGDQIYNTGSALAGNPVVSATMPHMQALGRAGDMLGLPKSIDMSGAVAANQPFPRPVDEAGKPTMQHLYDASQMIGQAPAAAVGLTPQGLVGKIGMGAVAGGVQGMMGGISQQAKAGQSPDFIKALLEAGVPAAWLGGGLGGALHLPTEGVKALAKKAPVAPVEPEIKVTRGTGNQLPAVIPKETSPVRPLKPMEFKPKTGDYLDLSAPKQGYLDLSPDPTKPKLSVVTRKSQGYLDLRQEPKPPGAKETPSAKQKQEYLDLDQAEKAAQDIVDAEVVQHFGKDPDIFHQVKERLKGIAEASDDEVGGLMAQAFKEVKEADIPTEAKATLRKAINKAYEANPESVGILSFDCFCFSQQC